MESNLISQQLKSIDERLEKLEKIKVSKWDQISKIATTLIPAVIAFVGYLITRQISEAEIVAATENTRVSQAELVSKFMPYLNSEKPNERIIAVQGILISLDSLGLQIASTVLNYDPDSIVQSATQGLLRRSGADLEDLVYNIYDKDRKTRMQSIQLILDAWRKDPMLIAKLIDEAKRNPNNINGLINSLYILSELDTQQLEKYRNEVDSVAQYALKIGGPQTREMADKVIHKLNGEETTIE